MRNQDLLDRTFRFAVDAVRFVEALPPRESYRIVQRQLMRCATSVAANYRAASRARSRNEFIAKLGIVIEEADECVFWLDLLESLGCSGERRRALRDDADALVAIVFACRTTARQNARNA